MKSRLLLASTGFLHEVAFARPARAYAGKWAFALRPSLLILILFILNSGPAQAHSQLECSLGSSKDFAFTVTGLMDTEKEHEAYFTFSDGKKMRILSKTMSAERKVFWGGIITTYTREYFVGGTYAGTASQIVLNHQMGACQYGCNENSAKIRLHWGSFELRCYPPREAGFR